MKEIIDQYAPILEGKVDVADVKKKQKQLRLNNKTKSRPLQPLKKINEESRSKNIASTEKKLPSSPQKSDLGSTS